MKPIFSALLLVLLSCKVGAQHLSATELEAIYKRHAVVDTPALKALHKPDYRPGTHTAIAGGIVAAAGFVCIGYLVYGPPNQSPALFYLGLPLIGSGIPIAATGGAMCLVEALRYRRDYKRATCEKYQHSRARQRREARNAMPVVYRKRRNNKLGTYITGGLAATYIADGILSKRLLENSLHIAGSSASFIYCESQYIKYNRQCKATTPHISLYAGDKGVGLAYNF